MEENIIYTCAIHGKIKAPVNYQGVNYCSKCFEEFNKLIRVREAIQEKQGEKSQ